MTGFAVYVKVVVVVSCALAPIPQCGGSRERLSHAKGQGSGALGRLKWLPVPFNPLLSRILGQALRLILFSWFSLFLRLCEIVPRYNEWRLCSFIPVGCITLPLSRNLCGEMDDVFA